MYGGDAQARTCPPAEHEIIHEREAEIFVLCADFDRVTAERDALHRRLTATDERVDRLEGVLRNAETVIGQFMPNAGTCFGLDCALLNETLLGIRAELRPAGAERSHDIHGTSGLRLSTLAHQGE